MIQRTQARNITEGVIWKQLLLFFFPILMGSFFQQMYNTVDTIIVGRAVGTQALAAVGSTSSLINLINGFFIGLSTGATVILSQYFGANDQQGVQRALHTGVGLAIVLGVLASALGVLAGPTVLKMIRTPESCLQDASVYVRIYFLGAIASMIYNMGSGILRAMGDSRRPMVFLIISCFVNILLDILCVIVLRLGIAGAAIATVLSQVISAFLVILTLIRMPEGCTLHLSQVRIHGDLLRRLLLIGVPAGLQYVTFDFANLLVQSGINSFGEITVAAWTAFVKTDAITWMVSGALGVAVTTFVGQNFGAQRFDRIRQCVRLCMGIGVVLMGSTSALTVIFRHFLLGIYTTDAAVIQMGSYAMLFIVPFNFFFVPVEVFAGTMRGTGYSIVPTAITSICVCLSRVVWIFTMVRWFHTIEVLAVIYPISWLLASSVFFVVYRRKKWLHPNT